VTYAQFVREMEEFVATATEGDWVPQYAAYAEAMATTGQRLRHRLKREYPVLHDRLRDLRRAYFTQTRTRVIDLAAGQGALRHASAGGLIPRLHQEVNGVSPGTLTRWVRETLGPAKVHVDWEVVEELLRKSMTPREHYTVEDLARFACVTLPCMRTHLSRHTPPWLLRTRDKGSTRWFYYRR